MRAIDNRVDWKGWATCLGDANPWLLIGINWIWDNWVCQISWLFLRVCGFPEVMRPACTNFRGMDARRKIGRIGSNPAQVLCPRTRPLAAYNWFNNELILFWGNCTIPQVYCIQGTELLPIKAYMDFVEKKSALTTVLSGVTRRLNPTFCRVHVYLYYIKVDW